MTDQDLSPQQQAMVGIWEKHMAAEFKTKNIYNDGNDDVGSLCQSCTCDDWWVGYNEVRHFYNTYFIPCQPPDTDFVPVSRTVGKNRIVDELIHKFTQTIEMPWILPGVRPTGRRVEIAVVVIVQFKDGKIAGEHIYWDQGSVLAQVGLLDAEKLPTVGIEAFRKVIDPSQEPSNSLIKRTSE